MLKKHFFSEMSYIWRRLFKIKKRETSLEKVSIFVYLLSSFGLADS